MSRTHECDKQLCDRCGLKLGSINAHHLRQPDGTSLRFHPGCCNGPDCTKREDT